MPPVPPKIKGRHTGNAITLGVYGGLCACSICRKERLEALNRAASYKLGYAGAKPASAWLPSWQEAYEMGLADGMADRDREGDSRVSLKPLTSYFAIMEDYDPSF